MWSKSQHLDMNGIFRRAIAGSKLNNFALTTGSFVPFQLKNYFQLYVKCLIYLQKISDDFNFGQKSV